LERLLTAAPVISFFITVFDFTEIFSQSHDIPVDISPRIKNAFEIQPLRWIVERTFSWFNGSRRLDKDFEMKSFYQEQICIISNFATLLRRF